VTFGVTRGLESAEPPACLTNKSMGFKDLFKHTLRPRSARHRLLTQSMRGAFYCFLEGLASGLSLNIRISRRIGYTFNGRGQFWEARGATLFNSKRFAIATVVLGAVVFGAGFCINELFEMPLLGDLSEGVGTAMLVLGACLLVRLLTPTSYVTYLLYAGSTFLVLARTLDVTEEIRYFDGWPLLGDRGWGQSTLEGALEGAGYIFVLITLLALIFELSKLKEAAERAHQNFRRLHEKALHLARVADMSVEAVIGANRSGRIQTLNAGACSLFGYSQDEAVGLPLEDLFRGGLSATPFKGGPRRTTVEVVQRVLAGRTVQDVDLIGVTKDKRDVAVAATFSPVVECDGEVVGISAFIRNIAARKKVEAELINSRKLLAGALQSANVGMFIMTDARGMLEYNARMEEITGFSLEAIHEQGLEAALNHAADISAKLVHRIRKQVLGDGRALDFRNLTIRRKDGTERICNLSLVPVFDDHDKPIAVAGVAVDVTEREALQAKLLESQKLESVGRLAGGVAHDFNNILGGILGYATLMAETAEPGTTLATYAKAVETAALRAAELTRQLLTFARSGKFRLEVVDLNETVRETLKLLESSFVATMSLEFIPGDGLNRIDADKSQIEQVLMNLCLNSRDAVRGRANGRVTVSTRNTRVDGALRDQLNLDRRGDYVCMAVEDNGCGIEPGLTQKIFDPFFTTKRQGEGYGLGLSVVYGVVENHHGGIRVTSSPDRGTRVETYFPAVREKTPLPQHEPRPVMLRTVQGTETVLVVDDEKFMRALAHDILGGHGYTILEAGSGEEALEVYRERAGCLDLIVLDLLMPGMDGSEALEEMRKLNPDVRCIISSGFGTDQIDKKQLDGPFVRFVPKPYTASQLLLEVRALLDA
jgi:PAS domain S-box-containing protein